MPLNEHVVKYALQTAKLGLAITSVQVLSLQAEAPSMNPHPALDSFTKLLQATAEVKMYVEHGPNSGFVAQLVPLK